MKVIIMAQGQQTRMAGVLTCPKQWVHLPYLTGPIEVELEPADANYAGVTLKGNTEGELNQEPILVRTLRQVFSIGARDVTVVATPELRDCLAHVTSERYAFTVTALKEP